MDATSAFVYPIFLSDHVIIDLLISRSFSIFVICLDLIVQPVMQGVNLSLNFTILYFFFFSWGLNPIIVCGVIARSRQKVPEIVPGSLCRYPHKHICPEAVHTLAEQVYKELDRMAPRFWTLQVSLFLKKVSAGESRSVSKQLWCRLFEG